MPQTQYFYGICGREAIQVWSPSLQRWVALFTEHYTICIKKVYDDDHDRVRRRRLLFFSFLHLVIGLNISAYRKFRKKIKTPKVLKLYLQMQ